MFCRCDCCCAPVPASLTALLTPGIQQRLRRFSSVRWVNVVEDVARDCFYVTYMLITDEWNTVKVPLEWARNEEYGRIFRHITKDLA